MARKKLIYVFSNKKNKKNSNTKKSIIKDIVFHRPKDIYLKLTFRALIPCENSKVLIFNVFGDPNKTVVIIPPVKFPLKAKLICKPPEEVISAYLEKKKVQ